MTVTLKNPTRQPASYTLTLQCVTPELPSTPTIRMRSVYPEDYIKAPAMVAETVRTPPTITISGREKLSGLPDAVADAPEIRAAVQAGQLIVLRDADPVHRRTTAEKTVAVAESAKAARVTAEDAEAHILAAADKIARDAELSMQPEALSGPVSDGGGATPVPTVADPAAKGSRTREAALEPAEVPVGAAPSAKSPRPGTRNR